MLINSDPTKSGAPRLETDFPIATWMPKRHCQATLKYLWYWRH